MRSHLNNLITRTIMFSTLHKLYLSSQSSKKLQGSLDLMIFMGLCWVITMTLSSNQIEGTWTSSKVTYWPKGLTCKFEVSNCSSRLHKTVHFITTKTNRRFHFRCKFSLQALLRSSWYRNCKLFMLLTVHNHSLLLICILYSQVMR